MKQHTQQVITAPNQRTIRPRSPLVVAAPGLNNMPSAEAMLDDLPKGPATRVLRQQSILQLQRKYGNSYVQRKLANNRQDMRVTPGNDQRLVREQPAPTKLQPSFPQVQRACGPSGIGSSGGSCTGMSGDVAGERFLFNVNCDDFGAPPTHSQDHAARLRAFAATVSADDVLEVHGFASEEGPEGFNDRLSCARANKAVSVLAAAGVSAGQIEQIYKHGSTSGDRAEQRSVVIVKKAPSAPPASPSGITVNPCPSFPFSLGTRGACGSGSDFTFHDFPSLDAMDVLKVTPFRLRTDPDLLTYMGAELGTLGGTEGINAISHFAGGGGSTRTHATSSPLSTQAQASPTYITALSNVQRQLHRQITAMAAAGTIDCSRLNIPAGSLPRISFGFADGTALKAVIGGTQGLEVFVLSFTADPATRSYSMRLRFAICDDFGVDDSDLYSPGLISFWVLQHERTGYRPFINELVVESPITGSF